MKTKQKLLRICLVSTTYPPMISGQATHAHNLAEKLADLGHHVTVITSGKTSGVTITSRVTCIRNISFPNPLRADHHFSVGLSSPAKKAVRTSDLVHIQDVSPLSFAALKEAHKLQIPIFVSHLFLPGFITQSLYHQFSVIDYGVTPLIEKVVWDRIKTQYGKAAAIMTPTITVRNILKKTLGIPTPMHVISCGIELGQHKPGDSTYIHDKFKLNPEKKIMLYFGRVDSEKRIDTLLNAWEMLNSTHRTGNWVLCIAGEGKARSDLMKKYDKLASVYWAGKIANGHIPHLYNDADCYVMPSPIESQSITTLTAAAHGIPIITSLQGATRELVKNGGNGLLYEFDDAGVNLARAIGKMMKKSDILRRRMSDISIEIASGHSLQELGVKTMKVYRKYIT